MYLDNSGEGKGSTSWSVKVWEAGVGHLSCVNVIFPSCSSVGEPGQCASLPSVVVIKGWYGYI